MRSKLVVDWWFGFSVLDDGAIYVIDFVTAGFSTDTVCLLNKQRMCLLV